MHWTVKITNSNDEYGWFDYAQSDVQPECDAFGIQHTKRAAPRFIETSIGPVCYEYEHVDREAIVPPVREDKQLVHKNPNWMLDEAYKRNFIAQRLVNLAILFVSVFVIATVIIYFVKHG
jgi:hypothetical protein